jgi:hypothetical protein
MKELHLFFLKNGKRKKNRFKASDKLTILRHLALMHQRVAAEGRGRLAVPADKILDAIKTIMPQLNKLHSDVEPRDLLSEIVERSGLMLSVDGGQRYQFAHLTLQEFFAADALRGDYAKLLNLFREDPARWRECVKLWCGLAEDATPMIRGLRQIEPFTALEGLADARRVDESTAGDLIDKLKLSVGEASVRTEVAQAFGALASDTRSKRGSAAFQFLIETTRIHRGDARAGAIAALAATNLPTAAEALAQAYTPYDEILRTSLVRLGDLAVTALARLASLESVVAIEDLRRIATARAAEALAGLLFDVDRVLCRHAAWHLATFFGRAEVMQRLRNAVLPQLSGSTAESWLWVWQPFESDVDSPLTAVVGRMAELIGATSEEYAKVFNGAIELMDQRLVVASLIDGAGMFRNRAAEWQKLWSYHLKRPVVSKDELEKWKDEMLHSVSSNKMRLIIRLCSLELIPVAARVISRANRRVLLQQYREQFTTIASPLSYADTWAILIAQFLSMSVVFVWLSICALLSPEFILLGRRVVLADPSIFMNGRASCLLIFWRRSPQLQLLLG